MTHDAWRDIAEVYISAFKSGVSAPTTDELVYYYRPTPKDAPCTDTVASQPTGFDYDADSIFVIAMLKSAGNVTITSGSNDPVNFQLPAGITTIAAPMGLGTQKFALDSSTATLSGSGGLQITNECTVYNFNVAENMNFAHILVGTKIAPKRQRGHPQKKHNNIKDIVDPSCFRSQPKSVGQSHDQEVREMNSTGT
ncbi:glycosyl hydrolase family 71-domain-containing protein [Mycena galopus ATCC 62051]|nr:glycosyl hydrolase family 71-domain-containing protein [Mycena galopus ATCC 62051]